MLRYDWDPKLHTWCWMLTGVQAVTDAPTVLKKTKSGRVSKQKTTSGTTKAAPKKAAAKKATTKKAATPKKTEAAA